MVGAGGEALVEAAGFVAEAAGERVVGDDAEADLVGDEDRLVGAPGQGGFERGEVDRGARRGGGC